MRNIINTAKASFNIHGKPALYQSIPSVIQKGLEVRIGVEQSVLGRLVAAYNDEPERMDTIIANIDSKPEIRRS